MRRWMKDWNKLNPILADGEVGEIIGMLDTKTGDGKTPWKDLSYTGSIPVYSDPFATSTDLAAKQDVGTAATDAELAAALDSLGPFELFYGEDISQVSSVASARVDIPGTIGTFQVVDDRPVYADYGAYLRTGAIGGLAAVLLVIDSVDVPSANLAYVSSTANAGNTTARRKRLGTLTEGEHTCKLVLLGTHATSASLAKGDAGSASYLSITKV